MPNAALDVFAGIEGITHAEQDPTGDGSRFGPRRRTRFRRCASQRERAESRCHPWTPRGHDSPAHRVQEPVDRKGRAAIVLAMVSRREPRTHPPFRDAPIQEHSNRLVVCVRPLEKLVKVSPIVPHDEELRNPPGLVSVAWPLRSALVATAWAGRQAAALTFRI